MIRRERSIEAACRKIAKARGCLFLKMNPRLHIGIPDRLVVLPERLVWWVEFKRPGELPTPKQNERILKLRELGHDADHIDDPALFKARLDSKLGVGLILRKSQPVRIKP